MLIQLTKPEAERGQKSVNSMPKLIND